MSLHAPFLVKQYLSSDVETGSYSRIFWYYPLDKEKTAQGGIGLFFEVLSGDVGDEIYEQITKRFWDSFTSNFYNEGFEASLKKSIKMFIQLLRNFDVEEGLDVNIVLLNAVESGQGYTLKLICFGDSDVFVVRQGKFADMAKMLPVNASLYDLKFLEVELDKGDVLMLGNKTLLRNAFETDMLALTGIDDLLRSLEEFKDNLFGSKKLFLLAATDIEVKSEKKIPRLVEYFKKSMVVVGGLGSKAKTLLTAVMQRIKKPVSSKIATPISSSGELIIPEDPLAKEEEKDESFVVNPDDTVEILGKIDLEDDTVNEKEELADRHVVPPPMDSLENISALTDTDDGKVEEDAYIVDPAIILPGKEVSVDDYVVSEEVTPSMVVEKSGYKELIDDASKDNEGETIPLSGNRLVDAPTLPVYGTDYVNELKARHSTFGKIARHPVTKSLVASISAFFTMLFNKLLSLFGTGHLIKSQKMFLTRPTSLEKPKKLQPGMIIILVVLILTAFFWTKSRIERDKTEKGLLTQYQQQFAQFSTFYDTNVSIIDTEDPERQLELCLPEAEKVYKVEKAISPKVKTEKNQEAIKALTSQVQAKAVECQTKYDRVYGIIRVKDAELVTDFKVSLGDDSDISAISFRSGAIVVADKGRKAVYQINVEKKSVLKLEDPLGLVVNPITVGTGEGTLFICDKTNGVLYYSKNASGNQEGFNRVVGAEPTSIGECALVEGYAKNAYVVPTTANVVYKITAKKSGGFEAPVRYIKELLGVRSLSIDGNIYVVMSIDGKGNVTRYYGGKLDSFAIPQSADLGELTASYTNPSSVRNLYVYDKTKNAVLSIEKPNAKHPGRGVVVKTYLFENSDKFKDVRSIMVDVNSKNQEVYMYVLTGVTIWRFRL